jgi:transposase-like protein
VALWTNAWAEFVPFLQFDQAIRTIICTTNAIESINARIRRAVNARGHFPTEAAALKCVYQLIALLGQVVGVRASAASSRRISLLVNGIRPLRSDVGPPF